MDELSPIDIRIRLDIKAHRFLSYVTKLVRILLVESSEVY